jgi:hypothetical protein
MNVIRFILRIMPNNVEIEIREAQMRQWKLYKEMGDIDGSTYWYVNGESLHCIEYHFKHDILKFRAWGSSPHWGGLSWDEDGRDRAIEADHALSILADYFEEQPTEEQLQQGTCKCWKYHMDFRDELLNGEITSDAITTWLENANKQYSIEEDITERLKRLSVPISITKGHDDYIWSCLDYRGVAPTFLDAIEAALEYTADKVLMYLEIFTETDSKNIFPYSDK